MKITDINTTDKAKKKIQSIAIYNNLDYDLSTPPLIFVTTREV